MCRNKGFKDWLELLNYRIFLVQASEKSEHEFRGIFVTGLEGRIWRIGVKSDGFETGGFTKLNINNHLVKFSFCF